MGGPSTMQPAGAAAAQRTRVWHPNTTSANRILLCSSMPNLTGQLTKALPHPFPCQEGSKNPTYTLDSQEVWDTWDLAYHFCMKKSHGSTCSLWQISFLCTQWKLRAVSYSSQPLLQQYFSHSQQIRQPASILASKSRTYMPILKSRSNLYSWVIRALMQGLQWKPLTQPAIKGVMRQSCK